MVADRGGAGQTQVGANTGQLLSELLSELLSVKIELSRYPAAWLLLTEVGVLHQKLSQVWLLKVWL